MDLALFDFDGTITTNDTFSAFLPHVTSWRRRLAGHAVLAPVVLGYKLGIVPAPLIRSLVSAFVFHGTDEATVRAAGTRFAREALPGFVRPHALERVGNRLVGHLGLALNRAGGRPDRPLWQER